MKNNSHQCRFVQRLSRTCVAMVLLLSYAACLNGDDLDGQDEILTTPRAFQVAHERSLQQLFSSLTIGEADNAQQSLDTVIQLLEWPGDHFVQNDSGQRDGHWLGLLPAIERQVDAWPAEQRQRYQERLRFVADNALKSLPPRPTLEDWINIARRYPATGAAFQAIKNIADTHFDRGQFEPAVVGYQRLLAHRSLSASEQTAIVTRLIHSLERTGQRRAALETVRQHASQFTVPMQANIPIDDLIVKLLKLADDSAATTVLPIETGQAKQQSAWKIVSSVADWSLAIGPDHGFADSPDLQNALIQTRAELEQHGIAFIPTLRPVPTKESLLVSTGNEILSLSPKSGRTGWRETIRNEWRPANVALGFGQLSSTSPPKLASIQYVEKLQGDSGLETLLLMDDRVCKVIETRDISSTEIPSDFPPSPMPDPLATGPQSRRCLGAFDLNSGKLLWKTAPRLLNGTNPIPGAGRGLDLGVDILSGSVIDGQQIFAVGQTASQLWLLAINGQTGQFLWQLPLGELDTRHPGWQVTQPMHKPLQVSKGILVCPTGGGTIVAVDLLTRSFCWAVDYEADALTTSPSRKLPNPPLQQALPQPNLWKSWRRLTLLTDEQRVILASPESRSLIACNLLDGRPEWQHPIDGAVELLSGAPGELLVVCRNKVECRDRESGRLMWATDVDSPVGGSCLVGSQLLVSQESATIASIDIHSGVKTQNELKSSLPLGNLVYKGGALYAQSTDRLSRLLPVGIQGRGLTTDEEADESDERQTAWNAVRLALERRDHATAQRLLRGLIKTSTPESMALYWDVLAAELRQVRSPDLACLNEIDNWSPDSELRVQRQILLANEYERRQQVEAARTIWQQLADDLNAESVTTAVSHQQRVSVQRWAVAKLAAVKESNSAEVRLLLPGNPLRKQRFLSEQFQLLQQVNESTSPANVAALKNLGQFMAGYSYPLDADAYYQRANRIQSSLDRKGNTLDAQPIVASEVDGIDSLPWPVEMRQPIVEENREPVVDWTVIPVESLSGTLYNRMTFWISPKRDSIRFDSNRQSGSWTLKLPKPGQRRDTRVPILRGWALGHLLVIQRGTNLVGVSAFNERGEPEARVIWQRSFSEQNDNSDSGTELDAWQLAQPRMGWGLDSITFFNRFDFAQGGVGPVTSHYICYRDAATLVALSPLSGQLLWQRSKVAADTRIVGNESSLVLLPAGGQPATQLRSWDGQFVSSVVNPVGQGAIVKTHGLEVVTIQSDGDAQQLRYLDLNTGGVIWQQTLQQDVIPFDGGDDLIRLLDKRGWLTTLDRRTGQTVQHESMPRFPQVSGIASFSDPYLDYVVVSTPSPNAKLASLQQGRPGLRTVTGSGLLFAISRQSGRRLWQHVLSDEGLLLDQPPEGPFLLTCCLRPPLKNNRGSGATEWHFKCISKRTGETVLEQATGLTDPRISWHWESHNNSGVELQFGENSVRFPLVDLN